MNIIVIGEPSNLDECKRKFGDRHEYLLADSENAQKLILKSNVVFDFLTDANPSGLKIYDSDLHPAGIVFLNTAKTNLLQINRTSDHLSKWHQFGFPGLPTFLDREILEISLYKKKDAEKLKEVCGQLGTAYRIVEDRVGLVTPRVICMIINEAYYTVQEGIATREDIDLAMRLGTHYPFGATGLAFDMSMNYWEQSIRKRRMIGMRFVHC